MNRTVTWIVLSNARHAMVVAHRSPGNTFETVLGKAWQASEPAQYTDEPGVMQSSVGPGRPSMTRHDTDRTAQKAFASEIMDHLAKAQREHAFDRIVLTGAPKMLGALRDSIPKSIEAVLLAELDKDLTHVAVEDLSSHLGDLIRP